MPKQTYDAEQRARLAKIGEMPDEDIDLSDIPEADDAIWKYARRPNQGEALVLPVAIEAKLFAWFARHSDTPENDLNNVLRQHIADADAKITDAKTRKRRA